MGFKDKLKEKLKNALNEEERELLPRGFQTLGKAIIIKLNPKILKKREVIGKAYLKILPYIKSVYVNLGKIEGAFRTPEKIEFLAGVDSHIVEHREHEILYRFDITKIMFSQGNLNERKFLTTLIQENEIVVDMFAGIGYFSLPIGKHSPAEKIYSIELNPISYKYFKENIKINHLEDKIIPILGDSRVEVIKLSESGIKADRVIMGVFPAPKDFIKEALTLAKAQGTIYHYEGIIDKEEYMTLFNEFNEVAELENFKCQLQSKRFVKSYGPNLYHVVLDIIVSKK